MSGQFVLLNAAPRLVGYLVHDCLIYFQVDDVDGCCDGTTFSRACADGCGGRRVPAENHARAHTEGKGNEGKLKAQKIDKFSRKFFPLSFVLFNMVYWIMYTLPEEPDVM